MTDELLEEQVIESNINLMSPKLYKMLEMRF